MNIGIIGAGNIGGTLGKLWATAGHNVMFGVRKPEALEGLLATIGSSASYGTPGQAASFGTCVLFAAPFGAWPEFALGNADALSGKLVIDAANPYEQRDGAIVNEVRRIGQGAGTYVAQLLPKSRVVKAFNTIYWQTLRDVAHRKDARIAVPIVGDADAAKEVAVLADNAGFDGVILGDLRYATRVDPGTNIYGKALSAEQIRVMFEEEIQGELR